MRNERTTTLPLSATILSDKALEVSTKYALSSNVCLSQSPNRDYLRSGRIQEARGQQVVCSRIEGIQEPAVECNGCYVCRP